MDPDIWPVIIAYTKKYDPDPGHAMQVCTLSLMLFDEMRDLHHMGAKTRDLLRAGSLLHDIGWSFPGKPHHKASRDQILADTSLPFKNRERTIVALIARYHRRSYPDARHALYRDLDPAEQEIVRYCGAILRIADMLDRKHISQVQTLECTITPDEIHISCTATTPLIIAPEIFSEKAGLLELLTNHRIYLKCN